MSKPASACKKIIFLIIASGGEAYDQFKREIHRYFTCLTTKGYVHEHYFLYGKDYDTQLKLQDVDLVLSCKDSWQGGILAKTSLACTFIKTKEYDFCVRTNLSALFNMRRMSDILDNLPSNKCYAGIVYNALGYRYVSGAGMILSPDVVQILSSLSDRTNLQMLEEDTMPDDVRIGAELKTHSIVGRLPTAYVRSDFKPADTVYNDKIHNKTVQFRFKTANRFQDVVRMKKVVDELIVKS